MSTPCTVAYVVSRFPKISETFILFEMVELRRLGLQIELFPLRREQEGVTHPEAVVLDERAESLRLVSWGALAAQAHWIRWRPYAYFRTLWRVLRGNARSAGFLLRALYVFPKAALFARRMREVDVDHIHAHYATHPALAAYIAGELAGLPYSFTVHAHDLYVDRSMLKEKLRAADFVVTISQFNAALLHDLYGSLDGKVKVIRCGVDLEVFAPRPHPPTVGRTTFTIVCVASLEDYKGHGYLIDACHRLSADGVDFRCLLVGEGEERAKIVEDIALANLQEKVVLLGRQPREQVATFLAAADVLVQPSVTTTTGKMEGIPVALMEALATEVPVVATSISGVPELIDDGVTGLLVPERDGAAIATAVRRLYDDPALSLRIATAGRAKVIREYDLHQNVAVLRGLLEDDPIPVAHTPGRAVRTQSVAGP